jgi:NADH:ubiquinone oxidoreductase subunit 6 (subunit J)
MTGRKSGTSVSDVVVISQGIVCTAFLFAVGINTSGLGLSSDAECYAAIRVCIMLYGAAKIFVFVVSTPFMRQVVDQATGHFSSSNASTSYALHSLTDFAIHYGSLELS